MKLRIMATALALWLCAAATAHAADEIHWTFTGPTSVSFDWRGAKSAIRYGFTPTYGLSVTASTPAPLPWSSPGPFWEARLTGLVPDRVYHYSIGGGPDHTFRTPRAPGTSNFTVMAEGDIGSAAEYWRVGAVQQLVRDQQPDFTLMIGDLTYGNAQGPAAVDNHFNDVMVWSQDAAYMPAWGNHEYENGVYVDDFRNYKGRFDLPNPKTSPGAPLAGGPGEDWYWFDYGNVRFIDYPEPYAGAWADWYPKAAALMDSAQNDPNIGFIVTFGHRPAFSSGHHPGSSSLKTYLGQLGRAHDKYRLNLNGHSHNYERTYAQNGVIHITAGGGGSNLEEDPVGNCLWHGGCPPPSSTAFRAFRHGPVKLMFSSNEIRVHAICGPAGDSGTNLNDVICTPGTVFDSVTIKITTPESQIDAPIADSEISAGQSMMFAGTGHDPDGQLPLQYQWDFDGGAPNSTQEDPGLVTFNQAGVYRVTLTVRDSSGYPDPTPAVRTILVGAVNHPPDGLIVAPVTSTTIEQGQSVTFAGSGSDPDGNASLSFSWDFDEGAPNVSLKDPGAVTFHDIGSFVVQLIVTDSLGLTDPTPEQVEITVVAPHVNQPPVAVLAMLPATGNAPLATLADATGSSDPDGQLLSYSFDFGDGTIVASSATPTQTHTYAAGNWIGHFTVTDSAGVSRTVQVPVIVAPVMPGSNFALNPSVETDLTGWTVYAGSALQRVTGGFDGPHGIQIVGPDSLVTFGVTDSPNWVTQTPQSHLGVPYRFSAWVRSPSSTGRARLQVREFKNGVKVGSTTFSPFVPLASTWQLVTVDRTVLMAGSTLDFHVLDYPVVPNETMIVDNISIQAIAPTAGIDDLLGHAEFAVIAAPNPVRSGGNVAFAMPHSGFARIDVIDLSGRRVRLLLDEREVSAGPHREWFDGRGSDGARLASGIYFYRVATASGSATRRFAILR